MVTSSAVTPGAPLAAPTPRLAPLDPLARLYAVGVQCIATSLGFFLTAVVKLPVPLYFPLSHRWSVVPTTEELNMDFFGRSLFAISAGAVAGALTLAIFHLRARLGGSTSPAAPAGAPAASEPKAADDATSDANPKTTPQATNDSPSGLTLLTVYAATALVLAGGVFGYQLYGRPGSPEPLPEGLSTLQMVEKPAAWRAGKASSPAARRSVPKAGAPAPAVPAAADDPAADAPEATDAP